MPIDPKVVNRALLHVQLFKDQPLSLSPVMVAIVDADAEIAALTEALRVAWEAIEKAPAEREWSVVWEWASHPYDGTQREVVGSERDADVAIAYGAHNKSLRKQWRTPAGPWVDAEAPKGKV